MKRQFYLDEVERDLLRCALDLFQVRLGSEYAMSHKDAHYHAGNFTQRRIQALRKRLAEPSNVVSLDAAPKAA